jgi:hypothetical protein
MNDDSVSWPYWWATFEGRAPAFIYVRGEAAAREAAATMGNVRDVKTLPYVPMGHKGGPGDLDFCHSPERCAGRTACPQSYSCTE